MKKIVLSLALLFSISYGLNFEVGHAKVGHLADSLITEKEACDIALKKVKGEIVRVELEEEDGKKVFEVKIKHSGIVYEVEVDAKTGQVLEVEKEGSTNGDDDGNRDDHDDHEGNDDQIDD